MMMLFVVITMLILGNGIKKNLKKLLVLFKEKHLLAMSVLIIVEMKIVF